MDIALCDDHKKVLFAFGQLQGVAQDWPKSFEYGRPNNAPAITWQEFKENFKSYHVSLGEVGLKQEEFLSLKQGSMSVCEYRNWFTQLSCYAPKEVDSDAKKQKRFLKGLNDGLQLQLMTVVYADYQTMVNRANVIENKCREMKEKKRKLELQRRLRNTHLCFLHNQSISHTL